MLSIISTIECPQCKDEAIEHYYCNRGERTLACKHCGYNISEKQKITKGMKEYKINDENGFGVWCIHKKDGTSHYSMYGQWIVPEEVERFKTKLEMPDTDRDKSFFVTYKHSTFFVSYGMLPENFLEIYTQLLKTHKPAQKL
ncbi:hypothetical protein [Ureibacillus sp. GCM10028918]|uniref:hypothetical protein n=1 Tax=Ureibacillus sp. GCM10028918 TaxID=3273429 RepID=UPI003622B3DD